MGHAYVQNYAARNTGDYHNVFWKATRCMLAAGWRYRASGDGIAKDTSALFNSDRWSIGGAINTVQVGAQTGTAPTLGAPASGIVTVTGITGLVAGSVGRHIRFTRFVNSDNNGVFRILSQGGTTCTIFNPNAVAETGSAFTTWTEAYGGAAASTGTAGSGGGTPGRVVITGLTGMKVSSALNRGSQGNYLTILNGAVGANNGTFLITRVISTTSVEIDNASGTSSGETNNGTLQWSELDPLTQVFPAATVGATVGCWIVLQGPSTLKVPIGNATPTGTFRRGENVTQATSGAVGEILGVVVDTAGSLGYLVIQPRLNGSGAGVRGWSNTATITGSVSGATVNASATVVEYIREVVFWRNANNSGHTFMQTIDPVVEAAARFSTLAAAGGVTAILAPGGPTGTFPVTGSWALYGTGGSNAASTGAANISPTVQTLGSSQVMVANCIGTSGVSEDGSWTILLGENPAQSAFNPFAFQFCENSEDGDVDPYVGICPINNNYTNNRSAAINMFPTPTPYMSTWGLATVSPCRGWRRRGMASADAFQEFSLATLANTTFAIGLLGGLDRIACSPDSNNPQLARDPLWVVSNVAAGKMRKGTLRWWAHMTNPTLGGLYDSGRLISLTYAGFVGGFLAGPWDGVTPASTS